MASKTPSIVIFFLSIVAVAMNSADAADPGFCRPYAKAALNQVHGGISSPACGGRLHGERWSSEFDVHYEWCLGASVADAAAERDARTRFLRGCAGR
jgi:hypothetical protein